MSTALGRVGTWNHLDRLSQIFSVLVPSVILNYFWDVSKKCLCSHYSRSYLLSRNDLTFMHVSGNCFKPKTSIDNSYHGVCVVIWLLQDYHVYKICFKPESVMIVLPVLVMFWERWMISDITDIVILDSSVNKRVTIIFIFNSSLKTCILHIMSILTFIFVHEDS